MSAWALVLWASACIVWPQDRPNLLLVTIDTLRADRLGCYGYARARTPALDRLAREGVRFERAFTAVPLTLPAHASILTGTYPTHHGVRDNSGYVLSPRATTLAEVLEGAGYSSGAFIGAFVLDSKFGLDQGFARYGDDFDLTRYENVSPGYIQRSGDLVVDEALDWLAGRPAGPFFAWVHLYDPHDPYSPPEPYRSRHPGRPYDGEIEFTDAGVGRLLEWLEEQGLDRKTLIVVVGDHGESLGEHGEQKHGLFVYNATLHVPLIIRLPGGAEAGREVAEAVSIVDIFPTVAQVLGLDRDLLPPEVQGRGLLSLMLGKGRAGAPDLYAESFYSLNQFGWSPLQALISRSRKLVLAPRPELYDLGEDFEERHDLAQRNLGLANRLAQDLSQLVERYTRSEANRDSRARTDAATLERLRSLGYVALAPGREASLDYSALPDPKDHIRLYNRVLELFERQSDGGHAAVIEPYREILDAQPDLKIVRYKLGQAYFHTGDYRRALDQFRAVIGAGAEESLATFDLAQTYLRLGREQDAILGFERTLEIDPAHYRARTNLGVLYKNQGRIPEAIEQLEKVLEVAPRSSLALGNLGVAYALAGRPEQGVGKLERAVALDPENAVLHANLGQLYRRLGREEEARREMETALRLNPRLFERKPK